VECGSITGDSLGCDDLLQSSVQLAIYPFLVQFMLRRREGFEAVTTFASDWDDS
jgi:hypothetical protein